MIFDSIRKCDVDIRQSLYGNVVVCGATSLIKQFGQRLENSIKQYTPDAITIKVVTVMEGQYSSFVGGSILTSLPSFQDLWITKEEYKETGASIVHRKCI